MFLLCTQILTVSVTVPYKEFLLQVGISSSVSLLKIPQSFKEIQSMIPVTFQVINQFSEASGLCLNINKCELLPLKDCDIQIICNIPIKEAVYVRGYYYL